MLFKRIGAFLLDFLILDSIALYPMKFVVEQYLPTTLTTYSAVKDYISSNPNVSQILILICTFYFTLMILYFAIFEYLLGSTPGKKFFGLKVISETDSFKFSQALLRNVELFILIPIWIVDLVYFIFKKKRLLEKLTKTSTVLDIPKI